jgi:hypothetical protein
MFLHTQLIIILALNPKRSPIKFTNHFQAFLLVQFQELTVQEKIAQLVVRMALIAQIMFTDQGTDMTMDILWDTDMDGDAVDVVTEAAMGMEAVMDTEVATVKL